MPQKTGERRGTVSASPCSIPCPSSSIGLKKLAQPWKQTNFITARRGPPAKQKKVRTPNTRDLRPSHSGAMRPKKQRREVTEPKASSQKRLEQEPERQSPTASKSHNPKVVTVTVSDVSYRPAFMYQPPGVERLTSITIWKIDLRIIIHRSTGRYPRCRHPCI